jgi:hypothetical protein
MQMVHYNNIGIFVLSSSSSSSGLDGVKLAVTEGTLHAV